MVEEVEWFLEVLFLKDKDREEVLEEYGHFGRVQECPGEIFLSSEKKRPEQEQLEDCRSNLL